MAWDVIYYAAADGTVPAIEFLDGCPTKVAANLLAVLDAVAEAPPPRYSGGGKWEAMHGAMGGYYEVRATGRGREQFRLFCLLENADAKELARRGLERPAIAVITVSASPGARRSPTATIEPSESLATATCRTTRAASRGLSRETPSGPQEVLGWAACFLPGKHRLSARR